MSVIHKQDKPDQTEEIKSQLTELQNKETATAQLLGVAFQSAIISDRASGAAYISDTDIMNSTSLVVYPDWKENKEYKKGEVLKDPESGSLFEVVAAHASNAAYPIATTFAYYRLIELEHNGTLADPIPYPEAAGVAVNVKSGLYYGYKGDTYKALADMPYCVYPPDTADMWQWEKQVNTRAKRSK